MVPVSRVSLEGHDLRLFCQERDFTVDYDKSLVPQIQPTASRPKLLNLDQGQAMAKETLIRKGYKLSLSQENTPGDGNCFLWTICDQMSYDSQLSAMSWTPEKARDQVVSLSELIIATSNLEWPIKLDNGQVDQDSIATWKSSMAKDGVYVDEMFVQICSEILR